MKFLRLTFWLLLLAALSACSGSGLPSGVPTGASLPDQPIQAGDCTLHFQGAQVSELYPPGCTPGAENCLKMEDGKQLLIVFLKGDNACDVRALADTIAFEKELYLLAPNGTRSERLITGVEQELLALGFSLKSPANNLLLVWAKNPPVKLPDMSSP